MIFFLLSGLTLLCLDLLLLQAVTLYNLQLASISLFLVLSFYLFRFSTTTMTSRKLPVSLINLTQMFHPGLTQKQNLQIFEIYHQKAKDKRAATIAKHAFRLECMQKKSNNCIAAAAISATSIPIPTLA